MADRRLSASSLATGSTPGIGVVQMGAAGPDLIANNRQLLADGIFVSAVVYPAVSPGQARLRLCATAAHTDAHFERLFAALRDGISGVRRHIDAGCQREIGAVANRNVHVRHGDGYAVRLRGVGTTETKK